MRTVESYIEEFTAKKKNPGFVGNLDCGLIELSHVRHRHYSVSQVDTTVTITVGFFSVNFEMTVTKNGMYPHRQRVWKALKQLNNLINQPEWTESTSVNMWGHKDGTYKYKLTMLYQYADMFGVPVEELEEKLESQFKLIAHIYHPDKGGNGYIFDNYVTARNNARLFISVEKHMAEERAAKEAQAK